MSNCGSKRRAAMFTRISNTLAGVLAGISHKSAKYHDPDICLFEDDPAALAYLQMRPKRRPPSADFGADTRDIW
jgi:hypothetical protein